MAKNSPKTILVVDDNRDSRSLLKSIVESEGLRAVEAADGLKALELARCERPSLIFMDLFMPIMDGLEATRRIRADETLSRIPVIAVTAVWGVPDALGAGCTDYIRKPIEVENVEDVLKSYLR